MMTPRDQMTTSDRVRERLLARNAISAPFFEEEAARLAEACRRMSIHFEEGGRLLAFGRGPYATDAQHVSVEFVHPVIVGKRALPALDMSPYLEGGLARFVGPDDMAMGFGPPGGDPAVETVLAELHEKNIFTFALPGRIGHYAAVSPSEDPFIHQELFEVLYHTLWETVHVFFEHREMGHDVGESEFLYPFLGQSKQDTTGVVDDVAESIVTKAAEDERLRLEAAAELADELAAAARSIRAAVAEGGQVIALGNGGSATDANDFASDCMNPPKALRPIPAISLAAEAANVTAIANDIGAEAVFLRQLIAQARKRDVVVAFSTSGSSKNIVAALEEARKRGQGSIAFVGYDGGEIADRKLADHLLTVRSDHIPRIQELHASLYHVMREAIDEVAEYGV